MSERLSDERVAALAGKERIWDGTPLPTYEEESIALAREVRDRREAERRDAESSEMLGKPMTWKRDGRPSISGEVVKVWPVPMHNRETGESYTGHKFLLLKDDGDTVWTCGFDTRRSGDAAVRGAAKEEGGEA